MRIKILPGATVRELGSDVPSIQTVSWTIRSAWRMPEGTYRFRTGYDGRLPPSGQRHIHEYEVGPDHVEVLTKGAAH